MLNLIHRAERACQRRASRWLQRRPFTIRPGRGLISFTFDDFPRSALLTGGAILEEHGARGTYYTSLGLAGRTTECGEMFRIEELPALLEHGHELGCHTHGHCPAWETPPERFEAEIGRNAAALKQHIPNARFETLSYPISHPRPQTKHRAGKYFACCRGAGQTFNSGTIDLDNVSAFFLEQSVKAPEAIRQVIVKTQAAGGWLVLATHDICETPSRFGCTPSFFRDVVKFAASSGAEILPMAKALERLTARSRSSL